MVDNRLSMRRKFIGCLPPSITSANPCMTLSTIPTAHIERAFTALQTPLPPNIFASSFQRQSNESGDAIGEARSSRAKF